MALSKALVASLFLVGLAAAQSNSPFCDSASGICFQGYTDPELDITIGLVLPDPPTDEFIVQMVAPASYGYTGLSVGGTMADSLLFTLWPYNNEIILGTRWTSGYVLPEVYTGPTITLLPSSTVNSTYIKATFRCQNCTTWTDGSLGSGDQGGFQLIAYVAQTTTPPDDPSDVGSTIIEHNDFDFFGMNLTQAQSTLYSSYIAGSSASTTSAPTTTSRPSSTSVPPSSTSSASGATQTEWGQCGGQGWSGPTTCASGLTCVPVSPPYYSQCQA